MRIPPEDLDRFLLTPPPTLTTLKAPTRIRRKAEVPRVSCSSFSLNESQVPRPHLLPVRQSLASASQLGRYRAVVEAGGGTSLITGLSAAVVALAVSVSVAPVTSFSSSDRS